MRKYWLSFLTSLQNDLTYRSGFFIWRLRQIVTFLIPYFLWTALMRHTPSLYNYTLPMILTYIFLSVIIRSLVFGSGRFDLANAINSGYLSFYLLKPINIFIFSFANDLSDKLINLSFIVFELPLLYLLFHPPLFLQTNFFLLFQFIVFLILAILMYFLINNLISMLGFWTRETWAPRFLLWILLEFATGAILPLDMLPVFLQKVLLLTPFPYMLFVPLQAYLGRLGHLTWLYFLFALMWLFLLKIFTAFVWTKGLLVYEAEGQ